MSIVHRIALPIVGAVLLVGGASFAQDGGYPGQSALDEGPLFETPDEAVEAALKPIRDQVINMQAKIERGVAGAAPRLDPNAPPVKGWAAECCTRNLVTLHNKLPDLGATAVRLGRAYRAAGRKDGDDLARELFLDAESLGKYLAQFASARSREQTLVMLEHVVRAVMNLNIDHRRLRTCCNDIVVPVVQESQNPPD